LRARDAEIGRKKHPRDLTRLPRNLHSRGREEVQYRRLVRRAQGPALAISEQATGARKGRNMPQESPQTPSFEWSTVKETAALLVSEEELTLEEIAERVGVDRKTIYHWRKHPEFAAKVQALVEEFGNAIARKAISRRTRRLDALNRRWLGLQQIIVERAADPAMADVPGGKTGLVVKQTRRIGGGESARELEEFEVDVGLLKELREHEKQAAIEVGQWAERREVSGPHGEPLAISFIEFAGPPAAGGDSPPRP
jgi:AcrR family transcriptional regulator